MKKITEEESVYKNLENLSALEIVEAMNAEDFKVAQAVKGASSEIALFIEKAFEKLNSGGRMFYIGAGTSGRLGILDASECPPTFGVSPEKIQGIIAGGDDAIRKAVEGAEDDMNLAQQDLDRKNFSVKDVLVGIAASGTTPYVIGGLKYANELGAITGSITCNPDSPVEKEARYPMMVNCGPEFVTGSTRLKSGTATKMVLNMLSTGLMIKLGHVKGNRMVDMQLSNKKLVDRGTKMVAEALNISYEEAKTQLLLHGSVRKAINAQNS